MEGELVVYCCVRYYGNMVDAFTSQLEESNPVPLGCGIALSLGA